MSRGALTLLVVTFSFASVASAQEETRVLERLRVDAWDTADLAWAPAYHDEYVRIVVSGTLTSTLDGAQIDARRVARGSAVDESVTPLLLPEGSLLVEERGPHVFVFDVPRAAGIQAGLNLWGLGSRHMVTPSEYRASLRGALVVEVIAPVGAALSPSASAPTAAAPLDVAAPSQLLPIVGGVSVVSVLALGLLAWPKRRPERDLLARARRAQRAVAAERTSLGEVFEGAKLAADKLMDAATRQHGHLGAIDRALAKSRWVRGDAARARIGELERRRAEGVSVLERIVGRLEEASVRLAACAADRGALRTLERDLESLGSEVEVGELVEVEVATLGAD